MPHIPTDQHAPDEIRQKIISGLCLSTSIAILCLGAMFFLLAVAGKFYYDKPITVDSDEISLIVYTSLIFPPAIAIASIPVIIAFEYLRLRKLRYYLLVPLIYIGLYWLIMMYYPFSSGGVLGLRGNQIFMYAMFYYIIPVMFFISALFWYLGIRPLYFRNVRIREAF